jgi:hypothetical protein
MPLSRLTYGLADAVPSAATSAWGCRAIITQGGYVDLVSDHIDRQGPAMILDLLESEFPPATLISTLARLLRSGQMSTRARRQFTLCQSTSLTVAADTLASADYCYLAAWTTTAAPE